MRAPSNKDDVRHTKRELAGFCALHEGWVRHKPDELAESLADVMLNTLPLGFICLRLRAGEADVDLVRVSNSMGTHDDTERIRAALWPYVVHPSRDAPQSVPDPLGPGSVSIVTVPIGINGEDGRLIAATRHALTDHERLVLQILADKAALVLQRRRADERLKFALRGSNIGIWEIEMPDRLLANARVDFTNIWEHLGYERPDRPTDLAMAMALIHSDDRAPFETSLAEAVAGQTPGLDVEHRVHRKDGTCRWMLTRGAAVRDAAGNAIRLIGHSIDITDRREGAARTRCGETLAKAMLRQSEERFGGERAPQTRSSTTAVSGRPHRMKPMRILLADDNEFNQEVIQHLLERTGHSVTVVGSGRAALHALEGASFDAMLLDCYMPEMDGFQVIAALRECEAKTLQHLPVIALTAMSLESDREHCIVAGMDGYLAKPVRAADLYAALERLPTALGRENPAASPTEPTTATPSDADLVDAATLLATCGGDQLLLDKMILSLWNHSQRHLDEINQAIAAQDCNRLSRATHKLRGLVSAFSIRATDAAIAIEQAAARDELHGAIEQHKRLTAIVGLLTDTVRNCTIDKLRQRCGVG
ncbi:MAG: hypothetical protein QOF78_255 [Phycisphaerales bacterium]|jgi:PAS domain S-box-containing protein|nr:hypothetical protein [Phycisphaerales bacterium]